MKTDELINLLSTNIEPVKSGGLRGIVLIALAIGGMAAVCLMLSIFGVPTGVFGGEHLNVKVLALVFALGLVAGGACLLIKSARPGDSGRRPLLLIALLFIALLSAGIVALVFARPSAWSGMVFGPHWVACLFCIPFFAAAPFVGLIWALRQGAPTELVRTGAITGLVAGALGAAVFAIHHSGGSVPFIALWYGGPILLCALVGAMLGPRLLRW